MTRILLNPMILLYLVPVAIALTIVACLPRVASPSKRQHLLTLAVLCVLPMPFPLPLGGTPHLLLPAILHVLWLLWVRHGVQKYFIDTYGGVVALGGLWAIVYAIIRSTHFDERIRRPAAR